MKLDRKIGPVIKKIRRSLGLTLAQLADKTGVSESQLCLIENGDRSITDEKLDKIAKAFGLEPDVLTILAFTNGETGDEDIDRCLYQVQYAVKKFVGIHILGWKSK